jgi:hypothetical protein
MPGVQLVDIAVGACHLVTARALLFIRAPLGDLSLLVPAQPGMGAWVCGMSRFRDRSQVVGASS